MKKITATFFLFVFLLVLVTGCRENGDPLAYQRGEITADIIICKNGSSVSGELYLGRLTDGTERDFCLVLTSPEHVRGIKLERKDGKFCAESGGYSFTPPGDLLLVAELFSLDGSIISAETDLVDGKTATKILVSSQIGNVTVYLSEDGPPLKISSDKMEIILKS